MKRLLALTVATVLLCLGSLARADVFNLVPGLTNLETVTVGDPGNDPDTETGYGSVGYTYSIGKYEVTAAQYCDFLNEVAATDTYSLYNTYMWSVSAGCKIERSGSSGSYTYSVAPEWANRPVNYVSFWDACRFANWLHNGQPTGLQDLSTTEDGAYLLNGYNDWGGRTIHRKTGWQWAVTSENEWYKAAYHKGGTSNMYWDYPMQSDFPTLPSNDVTNPDGGNNANFYQSGYSIDSPYWRTDAGEFENSESAYGTFDQGGNVYEWNESIQFPTGDVVYRGRRGGSWVDTPGRLRAADRTFAGPIIESAYNGFRVSAIPEPSSLLALGSGLLALAGMIRRRRNG